MAAGDGFRWRLADDGSDPQLSLFRPEELVERHVGIGEYRGLEFLHVNARRIINPVPPASRMVFRYTINAYRGCSHACVYCLSADTPVLMADGTAKLLKDVRIGDTVIGTTPSGPTRRYVTTEVRAAWTTNKPGFEIRLTDGTSLVASADHRLLTDRGWRFVRPGPWGGFEQALAPGSRLVGDRELTTSPAWAKFMKGKEIAPAHTRRVREIVDLDLELAMVDITTGTGDFVADGVVSHNCFARPTHEYLGLGIGEDFDRKIVVKVNAVERVRAELRAPKWTGDLVAMGTNTDPYQRAEGKYHLTQGIVDALGEAANPFSILTKSTLILRDLDRLVRAAARTDVRCAFSIGTLDEAVWKATEPGTPHPRRRVEAVRRLNEAGIPTGVLIAPIIPGLSDGPEQLHEVTEACVDAGATSITPIALHLRPGVKEHFLSSLEARDPALAARLAKRYRGAYLPRAEQQQVTGPVEAAMRRHPSARRGSANMA